MQMKDIKEILLLNLNSKFNRCQTNTKRTKLKIKNYSSTKFIRLFIRIYKLNNLILIITYSKWIILWI